MELLKRRYNMNKEAIGVEWCKYIKRPCQEFDCNTCYIEEEHSKQCDRSFEFKIEDNKKSRITSDDLGSSYWDPTLYCPFCGCNRISFDINQKQRCDKCGKEI
jgi:hypothetical protein